MLAETMFSRPLIFKVTPEPSQNLMGINLGQKKNHYRGELESSLPTW